MFDVAAIALLGTLIFSCRPGHKYVGHIPECYMVARLDGRNFTRLTKEICKFEAPFDESFRDMMTATTKALMESGFRVVYGYTESDEISLLFHKEDETFGRKVRKYDSVLAGTASANFSVRVGIPAVFDCRMILLSDIENVKDYFLWRQEDAHRNALNSHCYWILRKDGLSAREATRELKNKSLMFKNELLFQHGINYDTLPSWQKRGMVTDMKGFMDDRVLHDMKRAGEEAVKAQMITGSFITNLNNLVESKQLKKENLAAASNISERTLWRLRTDESYIPTLQTLLAVCVGMKLNFSESMILIEMSPHRLRHTMYQDGVYTYILRHNFDMEVDEINIYLSELGCRKLGNSM